jgi:transposase InsO family protein
LEEGYGREADSNSYHGGTIFRDAASKYIHVENQVSLSAGETVMSKLKFEEWLWEQARVSVRHYHSDNGVFTSELFKEACAEEKQTQSFSGVGAQHQNAKAERAIQTVMYMVRSFMIHAATFSKKEQLSHGIYLVTNTVEMY